MKQLPSTERRAAAENAYGPGPERNIVDGRAVFLVDDVITTGSTLRSAARVLRDAGATTVVAAALSHTEG
jgi:predicted amidophosphoribosyltransferase